MLFKKRKARIIYYDCDKDLALLKIRGEPIRYGDLLKKEKKDALFRLLDQTGASLTIENINKILNSYLDGTIPLTQEVNKGDIV